jgi:hypothetical protein
MPLILQDFERCHLSQGLVMIGLGNQKTSGEEKILASWQILKNSCEKCIEMTASGGVDSSSLGCHNNNFELLNADPVVGLGTSLVKCCFCLAFVNHHPDGDSISRTAVVDFRR